MALEDITWVDIYISFVLHFRRALRLLTSECESDGSCKYAERCIYPFFFFIIAVVLF
jgi:hypothetical protein